MENKVTLYGIDIGGAHPYDFLNKHDLHVEVGNKVFVKVGSGGAKQGKVVYTKIRNYEEVKDYKSIVEVVGLNLYPPKNDDENTFIIALGRVFRNQWNSDLNRYTDDWSDLIVKCKMPEGLEIKTGDIFLTENGQVRIVGFSTLKNTSKAKLEELKDKIIIEQKKSFFAKLFGL